MNEYIASAKRTIKSEYETIKKLLQVIDESFKEACELILDTKGRVLLIGMGKSGHIARKISATLSSTGTPSFFLHPAEATHGDLGAITQNDLAIIISNSGATSEIISILPALKKLNIEIISMTAVEGSELTKYASVNLKIPSDSEACPLNLAPTNSTTASLVLGDALAVALLEARNFKEKDFAKSHPTGTLGRKLTLSVDELMSIEDEIPKVLVDQSIGDAIVEMNQKGLGMTLIVSLNNELLGVFTDGDLRRSIDSGLDLKKTKIDIAMSKTPKTIPRNTLAMDALEIMNISKITSLVVSDKDKISGVVHLHDILRNGLTI